MKKDAYYFPHDSNAKDDPKCMLLIDQMNPEGYGIYWILVEVLRDQPTHRYPLILLPVLAKRYNTTEAKMKTVVEKYNLFQIENNEFFFSPSLDARMQIIEQKREQARIAGKKSAQVRKKLNGRSTDVQQTFNRRSTAVEQVKEIKEIKIKEKKEECRSYAKKQTHDTPSFFEKNIFKEEKKEEFIGFFFEYFKEKLSSGEARIEAENFYNYNSSIGWKTQSGKSYKDWIFLADKWLKKIPEYNGTPYPNA